MWLAIDGVDSHAAVTLNGYSLGMVEGNGTAARFDITALLGLRNRLTIDVSLSAAEFNDKKLRGDRAGQPGGLTGEVRLEMVTGD